MSSFAAKAAIKPKTRKNWGDDDEDDEFEGRVDAHGVKERTKITENSKGQKVKIVTRIRVTEVREKTPKRVLQRKNLPKFGNAKVEDPNRKFVTVDKEYSLMEHPNDSLEQAEESTATATLKEFIQMQAEREMARESGVDLNFKKMDVRDGDDKAAAGPTKYVPPGARGGLAGAFGGSSSGTGAAFNLDEFGMKDTTIRVSNLTKMVQEDDLRDLFEPFGKVMKVKLPRQTIAIVENREIKEPKGFAYITFYKSEDAEVAFEKLQGYGYDHLILRLEWAKPAVDMGGGGFREGGLSSGFVSGYGQKLAQDTKEKVTYTNTLATALSMGSRM